MNWNQIFRIQRNLDERIIQEHQLEGQNLLPAKVLALQVELGELANETRCFKYWSNKPSSPKEVVLEEYVDCLHFVLSIGLTCGTEQDEFGTLTPASSVTLQFRQLFSQLERFTQSPNVEEYRNLMEDLLTLGMMLGFTEEEIAQAYLKKNEINHQRQDQGY
ncbi:dUTP diphosphatase [Rubeoparvulum massiliense]|uniref:dUTP diphosphatase n=1 Tax=Rubeoparvulum massiliense TaxID=1631346 RepID=UPI00065E6045|nr:dUTP diphosphatase [Rubeoparvulum massiliense]